MARARRSYGTITTSISSRSMVQCSDYAEGRANQEQIKASSSSRSWTTLAKDRRLAALRTNDKTGR